MSVRNCQQPQTSRSLLFGGFWLGEVAVEGGAADAERRRDLVNRLASVQGAPGRRYLVGVERAGMGPPRRPLAQRGRIGPQTQFSVDHSQPDMITRSGALARRLRRDGPLGGRQRDQARTDGPTTFPIIPSTRTFTTSIRSVTDMLPTN
jgi:hypothetical protein